MTNSNEVNWKEDIEILIVALELRVEDYQSRFEFEYIGHEDQLLDYNPTRKHTCRCKKWQNCFKCEMASKSQRILNQ